MEYYLNILMVDDDQDDHDIFRSTFKDLRINGIKISEVSNFLSVYDGEEALDYLLKRNRYKKNKDILPDLIVLDLNMPITDGFEVLKQIQAHRDLREIPVYVLTTSKDGSDRKKCEGFNCAGFFSKPSARMELIPIMQEMLNVHSE